jgi:2-polyprenyl-6-methoxyphenol hydroxylase-like FAD-dependent oxidoreductase
MTPARMTGGRRPNVAGKPMSGRPERSMDTSLNAEPATSNDPDADRIPRPGWVPIDDVIGPSPDRQVLIVGTTPTGLVLALLLRAAGYDPVMVSDTGPPAGSRVAYLSPAAVEVLCVLDAGERVLDAGRPVGGVTVRWTGDDGGRRDAWAETADARAPAIAVPTPLLRRTLGDAVPADATTQERVVDSASQRDGGVEVTFDDGVREWFDVVVDAGCGGEPLRPTSGNRMEGSLRQYEAFVGNDPGDARIRDVWRPTGVVQWLPTPTGSRRLVRVTTSTSDRAPHGFGSGDQPVGAAEIPDSGAFDRRQVRQVLLPDGAPSRRWWGSGRIARCGPAACPAAPATGIGVSLGITDALGLVSALARDRTVVPEAVDGYADSRYRRFAAVRRAATAADRALPAPGDSDDPVGSLRTLRAVALEPFFGTAPSALGDPKPRA